MGRHPPPAREWQNSGKLQSWANASLRAGWQGRVKGSSLRDVTGDPHVSALGLGRALGHREANSGARHPVRGRRRPVVAIEDPLVVGGWDLRAKAVHREYDLGRVLGGLNGNLGAGHPILRRIVDVLGQQNYQKVAVAADRQIVARNQNLHRDTSELVFEAWPHIDRKSTRL